MSEIARHTHSVLSMETKEQEEQVREKALSYLRAKFPETEEQVFFTDYTGQTYGEVIQAWAVCPSAL